MRKVSTLGAVMVATVALTASPVNAPVADTYYWRVDSYLGGSPTDDDGLDDGTATNTGTYVSATDTGTDPTLIDSDDDGAEDWYEIAASFTDPSDPGDLPEVPYPLPDPDDDAAVSCEEPHPACGA